MAALHFKKRSCRRERERGTARGRERERERARERARDFISDRQYTLELYAQGVTLHADTETCGNVARGNVTPWTPGMEYIPNNE